MVTVDALRTPSTSAPEPAYNATLATAENTV